MKRVYLTALFFFLLLDTFSSTIGVGIFTDDINIWRYWERKDTGFQSKMIVFNTSDSIDIIELTLQQEVHIGDNLKLDTTKRKIFVERLKIEKLSYAIIDMPSQTERQEYVVFIVNNEEVGILSIDNITLPKDMPVKKYFSDEGLNGRGGLFWISKHNLITEEMKTDTIFLHFNYNEAPYYSKDGIHMLKMRPYKNFKQFTVTVNNQPIGVDNYNGEYILELPYFSEYYTEKNEFVNPNTKMDIAVAFQIEKMNKIFLGLSSASGINLLKKGQTIEELKRNLRPSIGYELPIMVE